MSNENDGLAKLLTRKQKILNDYGAELCRLLTRKEESPDFFTPHDVMFMEKLTEIAGFDTKVLWKPYEAEYEKISTKILNETIPKPAEKLGGGGT